MALFCCPKIILANNAYMKLSDVLIGYWLEKRLSISETTIPGYERTFARLIGFLGDVEYGGLVRRSTVRSGMVRLGTAWYGMVWSCEVRRDTARHGMGSECGGSGA
jgi:hypothetical protein